MQRLFVVSLWSGGRACKKWKTTERPVLLPQGTGVRFTDLETKLSVEVIGTVSVEEYEQGLDFEDFGADFPSDSPRPPGNVSFL